MNVSLYHRSAHHILYVRGCLLEYDRCILLGPRLNLAASAVRYPWSASSKPLPFAFLLDGESGSWTRRRPGLLHAAIHSTWATTCGVITTWNAYLACSVILCGLQ